MPQKKSKKTTLRKGKVENGRQAGTSSVATAQRASDKEKRGHLPPLQLRTDAAGIDIGSQEIAVAVPPGSDPDPVRTFQSFTSDLNALADWLQQCQVRTVAMESTGVYWIPLFQILEARGLEVFLVNAHHIKNVSGRPTDVGDCQWIQQLHSVGLLRTSFRPPQEICALRAIVRHRQSLTEAASQSIEHMQKALDQMNLHLHHGISDRTGETGLRILDAIVGGERDVRKLAKLRDSRIGSSEKTVRKALEGDYREEHLFTLRQSLEGYRFLGRQIAECDEEIAVRTKQLAGRAEEGARVPAASKPAQGRKGMSAAWQESQRREYFRVFGVDLMQIEGVGLGMLQTLATEVGPDLSRFRSAGAFTSWAGLTPKQEISGGQLLGSKTVKNKSRVAYGLRMSAHALLKSRSTLGDQFRRLRSRRGAPKAITAMARKLGCLIYTLVTRRAEYDPSLLVGQEEKYQQRRKKRVEREAKEMGYELVAKAA
jgi:transposase